MHVSDAPRRWPGYRAVWRWHFYAGLLCMPFILWLACTGSIYLWRPQIEALIDRPYADVATIGPRAPASAIARAAERAVPGAVLHRYQLPDMRTQAVQVIVGRGTRETRVYVDPQTLAVLKTIDEDRRLMPLVFALHGQLLLGDGGSYLVELAASWAIVMLLSGLFLWWPRGRGIAGVIYPRLGNRGRLFWRDLHAVVGCWLSVLALGFLISGLPWAASWGAYLQALRAVTSASPPADWTSSQSDALRQRAALDRATRLAGDPHAAHHGMAMTMAASGADDSALDRLVPRVAALRLPPPVLIVPPAAAGAPWAAKSDTQDRPLRVEMALDPGSGRVLSRRDLATQPLVDRVVGYGVAAHEGQLFGLANQLLNLFVAIGLVVLTVSGAIMWWRRRAGDALGAPAPQAMSPPAIGFVAVLVLLGVLLPLLGASMIIMLLAERLLLRRLPAVSRWLGLSAPAR